MIATEPDIQTFADAGLLSHSAMQTLKTCWRKYYLQYRLGLRPAHAGDPLRIGSMFHAGLEMVKAGFPIEEAEQTIRNTYAGTTCPPWLSAEDFAVEMETAVALVKGWHRRWGADMILEYVAVEKDFHLPILNPATGAKTPTFEMAGKIDGIAKLPDGRLAIVEHKTAGESLDPESDYWKRLMLDNQISLYIIAARRLGYDVSCIVYDVTRKPAIRPKAITKADRALATSQGHYFGVKLTDTCPERETPAMFGARLLDDMAKRPEFYFARQEITRLADDLKEFEQELWSTQRTIRAAELDEREWGAAAWPRNTGACTSMYRCPFLDVCRGLKGDPTEEIPSGFRRAERLNEELEFKEEGKESHDNSTTN